MFCLASRSKLLIFKTLSHTGYMEALNDHVGSKNEEQQPIRCQTSVNPFLLRAQTTYNKLGSTDPLFTQAKDSNGNTISTDNNKDLMLAHGQRNRWSNFPASSTPSLGNDWAVFPPPTLGQEVNQTTLPSPKWNTVQDSYSANVSATGQSKHKANIFEPFKEKTDVSQSMPVNRKTSEERDYLQEYKLANQKNNEESILCSTAFNQMNVLTATSSYLHPPVTNNDIFTNTDVQTPEASVQKKAFQNTKLFPKPASVQNGNYNSSDIWTLYNGPYKPQDDHFDKILLQTELGHGIFQESSTFSSPLNASTNEGLMFKKRPPKPAPRIKSLKNPDQSINHDHVPTPAVPVPADQKPTQTLFTPPLAFPSSKAAVQQAATNIQDTMQSEEFISRQVYEDVFFIGQEKCVEDWPEDSPELSPDWKPAGKFKLRRESTRISQELEAALNRDTLGKKSSKKKKKSISRRRSTDKSGDDLKVLQIDTVRRESKEKFADSLNDDTLPWGTKPMYYGSDNLFLSEKEEVGQNAVKKSKSVKSKKTKFIVPHLQYRRSKSLSDSQEPYEEKLRIYEQKEPAIKEHKPKKPMKLMHSLPFRLSEDSIEDDLKMMNGLSVMEDSKENVRAENENCRLSADLLAEYQHDEFLQKSPDSSGKKQEFQECRKKRSIKFSVPHLPRKGSKSTLENNIPQKGADLFKASDIKQSEISVSDNYSRTRKSSVPRVSPIIQKDSKSVNGAEKGADLFKAGDIADDDWMEKPTMDLKTKMLKKTFLPGKESKAKDQLYFPEDFEPPGATSSCYYLSEAAKAEWMSSQMDVRRAITPDEDEELDAVTEEADGDTDSLMEWWDTVELWDELPSDEEVSLKEDETKSFTEIADKVHRGLKVFYKVFTEQAEVLYQHVLCLYTIGDDISNFHRHAKIANITGGTTTAVGGVAAITGLALAPVTFGASLIVSAVGLGVATAGGITAASATIANNVHDMNDRKKIEVVVQDYKTRLAELRCCLQFVVEGVRRMRFHPLLRRNNYYTGDWEVRRALQTISLVGDPVEHAKDIVERSMVALNSVCKSMDNYFSKELKELKKGCKKEVTMHVNMLAKLLHEGLVTLNSIRDQLMEAIGHV